MATSLLQYDQSSLIKTLLYTLVILLISYCFTRKRRVSKGKLTAPEASGGWPIFGHLSLLKGPKPTHKTLGALADKYGPIFAIRIGSGRGLVVSNSEIAKECFTTNDLALASRPSLIASKHIGYDYAMFGFSPYGPFWREIRKIATVELLSNHRLDMFSHVWVSELDVFSKELHRHWRANVSELESGRASVEMKQQIADLTLNVILRMVAGKRYSITSGSEDDVKESRIVQKAMKEFFKLVGLFVPGDAIPSLRWMDLGGYEKVMKKTGKELDGIVDQWLKEHKIKREAMGGDIKDRNEQDFMDVMLSVLQGCDVAGFDGDTINKATALNLIAGGTDTTTVTLTWAISLLANNPHALKKAQDELDHHVGKSRVVSMNDINNLSYIQAIIKETLRLYPAAPLSGPHMLTEDCTIGGYHVSAGTSLLTNLWKIHTDPKLWPDPLEFVPERFLTTHKDVEFKGRHFEFIPFGSGRRACPGISFALRTVNFTLARFLQGFDFSTPLNGRVDMTESFGLTNLKATPLELLIKPRLLAELYG